MFEKQRKKETKSQRKRKRETVFETEREIETARKCGLLEIAEESVTLQMETLMKKK